MAEVKERNTEERATRMAERIWRETVDDSKLDIKKIRAICLFYLISERDQAVDSPAPSAPATDKEELPNIVRDSPLCTICGNHSMDARFHHAASTEENQCGFGSYAGSAPSSSTFTTTSADGAVTDTPHTSANIPAGTAGLNSPSEPTATQSGASATQGAPCSNCEKAYSAMRSCLLLSERVRDQAVKEAVEPLEAEVKRLKAERGFALDALREIHVAIKGARDDGQGWKEIDAAKRAMDIAERTVSELRAREGKQ